jgi:glycosyltransferase involved in cell wall biosynthesis
MNITYVCNEYPPRRQGGIGTFVYGLAHGLKGIGHNITVVELSDQNEVRDDDGVRVVSLASTFGGNIISDRRLLKDWLQVDVERQKTDIIEVPEFNGLLPYAIEGVNVVVRLHQSKSGIMLNRKRIPNPILYYYERETLRKNRNWIGVSKFILNYTKKIFLLSPLNEEVIYNFSPSEKNVKIDSYPLNSYGEYALFVGKLSKSKGIYTIARAANIFLKRHPDLRLVFLGKDIKTRGRYASDVVKSIVDPDLIRRVFFVGYKTHAETMEWMSKAKVFVSPSRLEAFSMVVLEAMKNRTPVVYSKNSSGPEAVKDEVTGLLVDPLNHKELAGSISRIIDDNNFSKRIVENAFIEVNKKFTLDNCIEATIKYYEKVIKNKLQVN